MFVKVQPTYFSKTGGRGYMKSLFFLCVPFLQKHWPGMLGTTVLSFLGAFLGVLAGLGLASLLELFLNGTAQAVATARAGTVAFDLKFIGSLDLNNVGQIVLDFLKSRLSGVYDEKKLVIWTCFFMVIAEILRSLFHGVSRFLWHYYAIKYSRTVQMSFFAHLVSLPLSFYDKSKATELTARLSNDANAMSGVIIGMLFDIIKLPVVTAVYLYLLFRTSPMLTLVTFLSGGFYLLGSYLAGKLAHKKIRRSFTSFSDLITTAQEVFQLIRVVKSSSAEKFEETRLRNRIINYFRDEIKAEVATRDVPTFLYSIITTLSLSMVAITGIILLGNHDIERQGLLMFLIVSRMTFTNATAMSNTIVRLFNSTAAGTRVLDLWRMQPSITDGPLTAPDFKEKIVFSGVDFTYGDEMVLQGINLEIRRGQTVGFVGPSGSGKTTLADLLIRLYDPTSGSIEFDGVNIRQFARGSYLRQFGIVSQETLLFNDSVAGNIAYGLPEASEADIRQAADAAYAADFIRELPQGYATQIGDRGVRLSGGQCQRLAIARAIIRRPSILVFDEATSSLDNESEMQVQQAINQLSKQCTAVIIAHRLSTVMHADCIFVLDKGRIVEQGRHDELLVRGGLYSRLYTLQSTGQNGENGTTCAEPVFIDRP